MPNVPYPTCIDCGKCGCEGGIPYQRVSHLHKGVYLCVPCQEKRKKVGK